MARSKLHDPEDWVPREVFAAYCGERSEKLLAFYDKARARRRIDTKQFDWLAVLLLPAWLGYRQQWSMWVALNVVFVGCQVVEVLANIDLPSGAVGALGLFFGLMAHTFLLVEANTRYRKGKQRGQSDSEIMAAMSGRAAPRVDFAVLALLGAIGMQMLTAWILLP